MSDNADDLIMATSANGNGVSARVRNLGAISSYKVDTLKDNNWHAWKIRMQKFLCLHKVFKYAEDNCPKPQDDPNNKAEIAVWEEEDLIVQTLILTNIDDQQMDHVMHAEMVAQMWESLKWAHQTHGVQMALLAKKELLNAMCPEGDDVQSHINKLKQMRNDLSAMGKPVPDEEFKDLLLLNMPESWTTFTMSYMVGWIAGKGVDSVTVEELTAILVDEYRHRHGALQDQTLYTQYSNKRKAPAGNCGICRRDNHTTDTCHHKGKPRCSYCQKLGHAENDCWKKNGTPAKRTKMGEQANLADRLSLRDVQDDEQMLHADGNWTSGESGTDTYYDTSFSVSYKGIDERVAWYMWIADSRSTTHISKDKALFQEMIPIQKEIQGIGNHMIMAYGTGTVELQACIGNRTSIITLRNVLYTPDAIHNLFSLTHLDRDGGSSLSGGRQT